MTTLSEIFINSDGKLFQKDISKLDLYEFFVEPVNILEVPAEVDYLSLFPKFKLYVFDVFQENRYTSSPINVFLFADFEKKQWFKISIKQQLDLEDLSHSHEFYSVRKYLMGYSFSHYTRMYIKSLRYLDSSFNMELFNDNTQTHSTLSLHQGRMKFTQLYF